MTSQLSADCLNEIFEYLEIDKITLRSCLLVNRLWCQVAVRILWRDVWSFHYNLLYYCPYRTHVPLAILSTLISCLPEESKNLLHNNGIIIQTPTSNSPLFNYASFCKILSIRKIDLIIQHVLENQQYIRSLNYNKYLISQELFKMFMKQISSLKFLNYDLGYSKTVQKIPFTYFPGAKECLMDLTIFSCNSDIRSEFFYQLSQICHNIKTLTITFKKKVSNGLKELISLQNNLKNLKLLSYEEKDWMDIIPALKNHNNTLTKLHLHSIKDNLPLSFISSFLNLQEIKFSFYDGSNFEDFKNLQFSFFPNLKILKIPCQCPKPEYVIKFLENNGKNLKEFYTDEKNNNLSFSIAKFCPNLKKLFILFNNDELNILKNIFNNCQYLESINIWCGINFLNEKEMLKIVAIHSPKNFYELKIFNDSQSELIPEDLENFFICWDNRIPKKSLSIIITYEKNSLCTNEENMKIIEKYKNLGIIKKFDIIEDDDDEEESII
ncbi:hypothetical protein C1645_824669 [Glomus cerebriforme]|uniref:F-box domain-containing protein n=1 Tax=Glomus cerebriforme TaxID=658196 RepID=A0A397SZZ3_9GLOM|nr:hypothetical protein C1645_824669 [Glomus cerebriforme]